jgi:DNA-binding GntR family transcriptional regulator
VAFGFADAGGLRRHCECAVAEIHPVARGVCPDVGSRSRSRKRARYAHIADELRARILAGRFRPDARLPSERALAEEFDVSRATIVSAFQRLRGEGLIETRRGGGSWVRRRP